MTKDNRYTKPFARISILMLAAIILILLTIVWIVVVELIFNYFYLDCFGLALCTPIPIIWIIVSILLGKKLSSSDRQMPDLSYFLVILAVPIAIGITCLTSSFADYYESDTFPYPTPFPEVTVEEIWKDVGHGQYGTITYQYNVNHPILDVEHHYSSEMETYCSAGWYFEDTDMLCDGYLSCRVSECDIPRKFVPEAQSFRVLLQSAGESETHVIYWETTLNGTFK